MNAITLRCSCCGLPWATLTDGVLEVRSRHNGKTHVNRISVSTLVHVGLFHEPGTDYTGHTEQEHYDND